MKELEKLVQICNQNLNNSKDCLQYLKERNIDNEIIERYKIGYFPQNINTLGKYVDLNLLKSKNIIKLNNDSDFRNYHYLIIPIHNEYGIIEGISGRSLIDSEKLKLLGIPKYKNSSYSKSNILFGFDKSLRDVMSKKSIWIVEGYFDQISMQRYGAKNCVALGGTAFSRNHFAKIKRYCNRINFLYDNDEAGYTSSERVYKKFKKYDTEFNFYCLRDHKDIDEYLCKNKTLKNLKKDILKLNFGE